MLLFSSATFIVRRFQKLTLLTGRQNIGTTASVFSLMLFDPDWGSTRGIIIETPNHY